MAAKRKARKPRKRSTWGPEFDLQSSYFDWLDIAFPKERQTIFAIPNGAKTSKIQGYKLKREGLTAGMPDIMIAIPKGLFHGAFIEFKIKPNKPSILQKDKISKLKAQGYMVEVCYDIDAAMLITKNYLNQI